MKVLIVLASLAIIAWVVIDNNPELKEKLVKLFRSVKTTAKTTVGVGGSAEATVPEVTSVIKPVTVSQALVAEEAPKPVKKPRGRKPKNKHKKK